VAGGRNIDGEAAVPTGLSSVVAITAGARHSLALKSDGTVVAWGSNASGQIEIPSSLSGVVAVTGGSSFSMALKSDGTVVGWEYNVFGQTTVPGEIGPVTMISTGRAIVFFLAGGSPLATNVGVPGKILTAGAAVNFTPVTAVAGASPYIHAIAPTLPAGLSFDAASGAIYGVPLTPTGSASFAVNLTDATGATARGSFTLWPAKHRFRAV
jgi:hypothetical protein